MQTPLRSRLSQLPHWRHIKDERKELLIWNSSLGGRSHRTGDVAFTPATPPWLTALESQHRLTKLTQHATRE
jgi:hypothetical protein